MPEIYDGTVIIRGAVREAGDRAKVAVYSRERDIDPVGACVGMKGTRVQGIIRELRGEKIDIVEWSDDPILFVTKALSPAKVQRVSIVDEQERVMEVVVEDMQLSLAIGKKGQNVRLGAKLTGWRIDIKSEEEKRREVEAEFGALEAGQGEVAEGEAAENEPLSATPGEGETAGDETLSATPGEGETAVDEPLNATPGEGETAVDEPLNATPGEGEAAGDEPLNATPGEGEAAVAADDTPANVSADGSAEVAVEVEVGEKPS